MGIGDFNTVIINIFKGLADFLFIGYNFLFKIYS